VLPQVRCALAYARGIPLSAQDLDKSVALQSNAARLADCIASGACLIVSCYLPMRAHEAAWHSSGHKASGS